MSLRVKEFLVVVCLVAFVIFISRQNSYTDVDATKIMDNIIPIWEIWKNSAIPNLRNHLA